MITQNVAKVNKQLGMKYEHNGKSCLLHIIFL